MTIPARIRAAVDLLDVQPGQQLLEVGCGPGVAAALIAERIAPGRLVAIDRSATAVARARRRNAAAIAAGTVAVEQAALAAYDPGAERFDSIFAVDVNCFWTGPARAELATAAAALRPGGLLRLCFAPPGGGDRRAEIAAAAVAAAVAAGFSASVAESGPLVCVTASR